MGTCYPKQEEHSQVERSLTNKNLTLVSGGLEASRCSAVGSLEGFQKKKGERRRAWSLLLCITRVMVVERRRRPKTEYANATVVGELIRNAKGVSEE